MAICGINPLLGAFLTFAFSFHNKQPLWESGISPVVWMRMARLREVNDVPEVTQVMTDRPKIWTRPEYIRSVLWIVLGWKLMGNRWDI